jgi:hypothetical protein
MPLEVIGAGYARTGTTSAKEALEILGIGPCYHMFEVFMHFDHVPLWQEALDAASATWPKWETLLGGYRSTVDWPASLFWRQLAEVYPSARVLLTVRDTEAWFTSVDRTILDVSRRMVIPPGPPGEVVRLTQRCREEAFGTALTDRDLIVEAYQRHNDEVRQAIETPRLLVFDAADGWGPLCSWLGVDVPTEPFPHRNTMNEFRSALGLSKSEDEGDGPAPP